MCPPNSGPTRLHHTRPPTLPARPRVPRVAGQRPEPEPDESYSAAVGSSYLGGAAPWRSSGGQLHGLVALVWRAVTWHGCWETCFGIFSAYCGSVVEIPTELLKFKLLLPFNRQPRWVRGFGLEAPKNKGSAQNLGFVFGWYPPCFGPLS